MSDIIANKGSISGQVDSVGEISGGIVTRSGGVASGEVSRNSGGTHDYEHLINLPEVNGETLIGDKSSEDLHIVAVKTSAEWALLTTLVSVKGEVYVYSDAGQDADGNPIPKVKIGDGLAYVVDLPFVAATDLRITDEDITNWNNKVSIRVDDGILIFY